jgi:uncharacterized membrane protein YphA (DoxX/SURF4 family)
VNDNELHEAYEQLDSRLTRLMARYGITALRISLGVVFLWFGFLKFFPGLSPAADLAARTIGVLSFGLIPPATAVLILAVWESLIGIGLLTGRAMRLTLALLWLQMLGTATPLVLFPAETWTVFPIAPTLEGQYIIKNLVLISAGLVLGATVRGGKLVTGRDLPPPPQSGKPKPAEVRIRW